MIWCGGVQHTARMLLREVFSVVTPDTQVSWSLHCQQNLEKTVPGGKVSGVALGNDRQCLCCGQTSV